MERTTKIKVAKIVLKSVAGVGFFALAVSMPNAVQALDMFWGKDKRKYSARYHVKNTFFKLKDRGFLEFKNKNGKTFVALTEKGRERLLKYQLQEIEIEKPKKWDKKWRLIIFDIKEKRRYVRDSLRKELVNLGLIKLQNSVWVYPYDCEEIVIMLKANLEIGRDILYVVADRIENDKWLKQEFGLI